MMPSGLQSLCKRWTNGAAKVGTIRTRLAVVNPRPSGEPGSAANDLLPRNLQDIPAMAIMLNLLVHPATLAIGPATSETEVSEWIRSVNPNGEHPGAWPDPSRPEPASLASLRMRDGRLPAFTDLGGYPIAYLFADGETCCPACANGGNGSDASTNPDTEPQWRIISADVHWEGSPLNCSHCGADIESAYGEPKA